jgi:maintenance of morphology protein 1
MTSSLPFAFQPTFTQGLVIGQLSILILFFFVFKYLFLTKDSLDQSASYRPRSVRDTSSTDRNKQSVDLLPESAEWLNATLLHVRTQHMSAVFLLNCRARS